MLDERALVVGLEEPRREAEPLAFAVDPLLESARLQRPVVERIAAAEEAGRD